MARLFLAAGALAVLFAAGPLPALAQSETEPPPASAQAVEPAPAPAAPAEPPKTEEPAPAPPPAAASPPAAVPTEPPAAQPAWLSAEQFREQLVGVPLCGVPPTGPLAGKTLCTVHLPDGVAVVAGSGVLVRGIWEMDEAQVCRRSKDDPLERRRCVTYERVAQDRYKNSDGVEVCLGPCGQ
jgi:hypothetical protein